MLTVVIILAVIAAALIYIGFVYSPPDMSSFDSPEPALVKQAVEISDGHQDVVTRLEAYHAGPMARTAAEGRERFAAVFTHPTDLPATSVDVNGVPGEWVVAENADPYNRLLYIHGGAFVVGNPRTHQFITTEISRRTGAAVLAIDYRKRPEFKLLHCHEDARTAYDWITENGPDGPAPVENLFVAGDSAGGNLTLSVIAWARDNGRRLADGAIAIAPCTDATLSSPTWRENLQSDHFLGPSIGRALKVPAILLRFLGSLSSGVKMHDPQISPLFGDLAGLPPTLIQVSSDEMLYGDAVRYWNKANREGSRVTLQAWPKLVHVFQAFADLPEAHDALDMIGDYVRGITSAKLNSTRLIQETPEAAG